MHMIVNNHCGIAIQEHSLLSYSTETLQEFAGFVIHSIQIESDVKKFYRPQIRPLRAGPNFVRQSKTEILVFDVNNLRKND